MSSTLVELTGDPIPFGNRGWPTYFYGPEYKVAEVKTYSILVQPGMEPIIGVGLPKNTVLVHWKKAEDHFTGKKPEQISVFMGDPATRLCHMTLDGVKLGTSIYDGEFGRGVPYVRHQDASNKPIGFVSIVPDLTGISLPLKLFHKIAPKIVTIFDDARFQITTERSIEGLSIGHGIAGQYFRQKCGLGFRGGTAPA